jgi:hypothetical protein
MVGRAANANRSWANAGSGSGTEQQQQLAHFLLAFNLGYLCTQDGAAVGYTFC